MPYDKMLAKLDLPKLATRRIMLKLTTMHKIVNNGLYFPQDVFISTDTTFALRSSTAKRFVELFALLFQAQFAAGTHFQIMC